MITFYCKACAHHRPFLGEEERQERWNAQRRERRTQRMGRKYVEPWLESFAERRMRLRGRTRRMLERTKVRTRAGAFTHRKSRGVPPPEIPTSVRLRNLLGSLARRVTCASKHWRNVEPVLANNGDNGGTHNEDNGTTVERTTKTTTTTDKSTRRGSADFPTLTSIFVHSSTSAPPPPPLPPTRALGGI